MNDCQIITNQRYFSIYKFYLLDNWFSWHYGLDLCEFFNPLQLVCNRLPNGSTVVLRKLEVVCCPNFTSEKFKIAGLLFARGYCIQIINTSTQSKIRINWSSCGGTQRNCTSYKAHASSTWIIVSFCEWIFKWNKIGLMCNWISLKWYVIIMVWRWNHYKNRKFWKKIVSIFCSI